MSPILAIHGLARGGRCPHDALLVDPADWTTEEDRQPESPATDRCTDLDPMTLFAADVRLRASWGVSPSTSQYVVHLSLTDNR